MAEPRSVAAAGRAFGVLMHPTSLPGAGQWGALGRAADHFLDWLDAAGATVWQVLPLGPVGSDGSPYFARSTHAGNPRLIDIEALEAAGWVRLAARGHAPFEEWHARTVRAAAEALLRDPGPARADFEAWRHAELWVEDYALARVLGEARDGAPWWTWPAPLRDREPAALAAARLEHAAACALVCVEQYFFHTQWRRLRERANRRGVRLFGDLPIYVAPDAVDVWTHRDLFQLDDDGRPTAVAGVPPDYFSADGQLWGNPLYRWERHAAQGFAWWLDRLAAEFALCDLVRIDHFRALEAYWAVPAGESARHGAWRPAPGDALLRAARDRFGSLPVIAEDLGVITPAVEQLRDEHGLCGMRVLQFGLGTTPDNPHLPHNWRRETVAYSGTHDNDTLAGWLAAQRPETLNEVRAYVGEGDLAEAILRVLAASVAWLAVVPMQDLLRLDSRARMNTPGTTSGNWRWTLDWSEVPPQLASRTRALVHRTGRLAP